NASGVTTGTFSNAGTLNVDNYHGAFGHDAGGSSQAIGSTLSNSGVANIGNSSLSKATTVTASGLVNSGTINLSGGTGGPRAGLLLTTGSVTNSGDLELRNNAGVTITSGGLINTGKLNL